ncbi:hypothetical protein E1B28_001763 [Marasmius oreades]|uniref:GDP-fucose protein O-fucosyltransferase n=1 Tax=Marasmius oreades TaxID=181124 RepID=A0A9P7V422_9AGAR|nr:uncharacterized protein E1B28_001763 [Marasmius oreades]KAG7099970.1 hypothetical protein E1B28_001763 [Marasmius oreades]
MPRPRPLTHVSNSQSVDYSSQSQLTPRTPHSRSGRAEEAYGEVEIDGVDELQEGDMRNMQNVPLLRSSASDTFPVTGYRGRGDDHRAETRRQGLTLKLIASRLPIVIGSMVAGLLLILIVVSYQKPGTLETYIGGVVTPSAASSQDSTNSTQQDHNHVDPAILISYENYTFFPLKPGEYAAECRKMVGVWMENHGYWQIPPIGVKDVIHKSGPPVCSSTITYMLGGKVGLVADLALMAQAAALAQERNRTFLVDDTYWNRGKWKDHFEDVRVTQPGPEQGCQPPPPEELVACPRLARHWIINAGTAKYHFNHGFHEQYEDPYAHNLNRDKPVFETAHESLSTTIRPNAQLKALITAARKELSDLFEESSTEYIAVHIRRGDNKASAWKYSSPGIQVPTQEFVDATSETWSRLNLSQSQISAHIASDSPAAIHEFSEALDKQWKVFSLSQSKDPNIKALASPEQYFQNNFEKLYDTEERVNLTRGIVVDLALLSGLWSDGEIKPQAVVCTIPSSICKISAIGFGWEGAFGQVNELGDIDQQGKRWVEIDEKSSIIPVWSAFNLFN